MPQSSALCTTLRVASRSIRPPKLLQPRPTSETLRPDLPRLRSCMVKGLRRRARSAQMIVEKRQRALQGEIGARFIVAAALVAIAAVIGVVNVDGHRGIGLLDLVLVACREVLILLAEMQHDRPLRLLAEHGRDAAAVIADGR